MPGSKHRKSDRVFTYVVSSRVGATPVSRIPKAMRESLKRRNAYVPIRNIKIYCDIKHNGLTDRQAGNKYGLAESSVRLVKSKVGQMFNRWRENV